MHVEKEFKRMVKIECMTADEAMQVGSKIHKQLIGNQDYIDTNILLNVDEEEMAVRLIIFEECEDIPEITI